jgi:hypothetical protein
MHRRWPSPRPHAATRTKADRPDRMCCPRASAHAVRTPERSRSVVGCVRVRMGALATSRYNEQATSQQTCADSEYIVNLSLDSQSTHL